MKKLIPVSVVSIVGFIFGWQCGYHGLEPEYRSLKAKAATMQHKVELIDAQHEALNAADDVMDKHELFDADGGDAMVKYLDLAHKADSLYELGM